MVTIFLSVTGVLLGAGGLLLALLALERTRAAVDDCQAVLRRSLADSGSVDPRAIRDVAMVRYDALEEMSGARSFSLAMLNATGDGIVLTSINGRTETRTYAKTVVGGKSAETLSPEEYRAVRAARLGRSAAPARAEDSAPVSVVSPGPAGADGGSGAPRPRADRAANEQVQEAE